ncbi:MAG: RNB domain-containing ribonuclease [Spirochaetia bacterium]|nr:RNB domain-containing ribonuclease [Spirochaetia bacterium]
MAEISDDGHRKILRRIAKRVMLERSMAVDFPDEVYAEIKSAAETSVTADNAVKDMTGILWYSIDNDDSEDLDQLTAAESIPGDKIRVYVAVADVDSMVHSGSVTDTHAGQNTLSVYTPARVFPMLPEQLSTGATSLKYGAVRRAIIIEMTVEKDGNVSASGIYPGLVKNKAKLAYNSVAAWLDNTGPEPEQMRSMEGLAGNIRLQEDAAARLRLLRYKNGALSFESSETHVVFLDGHIKGLEADKHNRAKVIIEDFMIAANGATARFLESRGVSSIRRVVHTPKRWDRIVELAKEKGYQLPAAADPKSLEGFLSWTKERDNEHFQDISISVIKLLGPGEYCLETPGASSEGHFGLAVKDYTHSTAPNRRYADLITQRLLKAAFNGDSPPYSDEELDVLAKHCTQKENDAKKIERQLGKSAAALLLGDMIGQEFDAMVTGASEKGTWVRIFNPPVEGRLNGYVSRPDVGHKLRVKLISADVERGYIDFNSI